MFNFDSQTCDVCGQVFKEGDDIVVCPDCGTPHHRECWIKEGHCVNQAKHAEGFEWKPVQILGVNTPAVKCPHCGAMMPEGTKFCENCGQQMVVPAPAQPGYGQNNVDTRRGMSPFDTNFDDFNARLEREMASEIDGVSVRDIYAYIGPNAQYYVYKFRRMEEYPGYKPFNWSAFMFRPLWYLYRRMGSMAVVTGVINLLLSIPTMIATAVQAGMLSNAYLFPGIEKWVMICYFLEMAVNMLWGFMAVPQYKKQVIGTLKKFKNMHPGDANGYYREIMRKAGPSKLGMAVSGFVLLIYILSLLI